MTEDKSRRKWDESKFWSNVAPGYDDWIKRAFEDQYRVNRPKFRSYMQPDDVVLEIGCGTGDIAFFIADKCKKVVGIDISVEMIKVANAKKNEVREKNIDFHEADAYYLPFDDSSFDKVLCCNVLQTMKQPERAIAQGLRVLKPGGEYISITYCFGDSKLTEYLKLARWVLKYGLPKYWTNFDCIDIEDLFRQAGFDILESEEIWKNPVALFLRCRK
jgi:ubiquinone/menaquinone biosynthesis C-methylase UbiE